MRVIGKILLLAFSAGMLSLAYTNCDPTAIDQISHENFSINNKPSVDAKVEALFSFDQPIEICENADNYQCVRKVFSPDVETETLADELACLSADSSTCILTKTFTINTESAVQQSADRARYDYNEVDCYNSLVQIEGHYVFSGLAETVDEAFAQAKKACLQLVEE